MKTHRLPLLGCGIALVLAGCSSVDSRVNGNPDFANWPPAVQQKVRAGEIDVGFTQQQVEVALGKPDYTSTRTTSDGTTAVWGYRERGPRFSFGVGLGSIGRSSSVGVGVGTSTGGWRDDEKTRVLFDRNGNVAAIEHAQR